MYIFLIIVKTFNRGEIMRKFIIYSVYSICFVLMLSVIVAYNVSNKESEGLTNIDYDYVEDIIEPNIESVNKEEPDKEELHAEIAKLKVEAENLKAQLKEASDKSFQSKEITNTEKDKIINELQQRIADYEAIFDPQDIKRKKVIAMTGKQHVILFLAVLAYHNKIPNARTNLSFLLSFISSRNESTMIDYLKNRITQEECDTLAQYFNQETPFIASLIRELPKKLEKDKSEKNRAKALNNTNK